MSEQDKTKAPDAGELQNDQLESVAGGVAEGGCIKPPFPFDPPIEIDPIFPPFQTE
jgi:hypothetical protein